MKRCNSSEDCHEFRKKEPHLQVQEVTLRGKSTQSSSSTVKSVLKRSIELKQAQRKEEEEKRKEDTASKCKDNLALKHWATILSDAGYYCEVRSLVKSMDFMPFPESKEVKEAPCFALIVERSRDLPFSEISGPFQAARLLVYPNGEWQIDSPIVEYTRFQVGMLSMPIKSGQLIDLARKWLSEKHVLCPGLVGSDEEKLEKELGYIPKNVSVYGRNYVRSVGCKIWHVPGSNYDQMQKMCGECLECYRYVKNALSKKQSLSSSKREKRQNPSSNYAIKYLTPRSKSIRLGKTRKLRSRMTKKVRKLYKQTSIELPQEQSSELCKLVQEIENSNEGKQELETIFSEGNQLTDKKGCKAGNCVKGIWEKDRDGFFKDQRKNVTGKNGNRWSAVTIRVALAVYTRSPSAYEALHNLKILQLPHSKTLKKVINAGSEKAGIDEEYLLNQHKTYTMFQKERERIGHPRPLGHGVMMWDEVKIQMKIAWNLKGAGITGFSTSEDELKVLHDVFSTAVDPGAQKASYIVQFLWRDLTSNFDLIGPYFPVGSSMQSSVLQEFLMLTLKALTSYGFKVSIMLCDGASSNLTVLKLLSGHPKAQFPARPDAETSRECYYVDASFTNPEDPLGNPIFLMICPSHQLKNMIAALYSSREQGAKDFCKDEEKFGWSTVERVFTQELERAENGLSRRVPGLKYAFVYRDNWTRLNVRPAKIMQQRFMIAAIKDLANEPNEDASACGKTAEYLEACNLIFEQGLLSRRRINDEKSPVLANVRKGMEFFENWCASHEGTVYEDNSKKSRQKKFLAWQTWDLLRLVVHGFLSFCDWFFKNVSSNEGYFISPLRINGSAIESIYSVLKFASGGNLSAFSYGPALGKLIKRKEMDRNEYSEKGYRDVPINVGGSDAAAVVGSINNLVVQSQKFFNHCVFIFPENISQSTFGDRLGSNACTLIAVKFGAYCFQNKLEISLLWDQLPNVWLDSFLNAICDGNEVYDELYSDTSIFLDVEDVVNTVGDLFSIESADQLMGFTNANDFSDLVNHISRVIHSSSAAHHYGIIIAAEKSVGFFVKGNGLCAIIDSHQHVNSHGGGMIIMANNPRSAIVEYSNVLTNHSCTLDLGTLNWVQYTCT